VDNQVRPTIDQYWAKHLRLVAERATCVRRKTGAIITDSRGAILSSGYNGIGSGVIHCGLTGSPCDGTGRIPGDSGNEKTNCWATHAEVNAVLQCHRIDLAMTLYTTNFPCFNCAKTLINTPISRIISLEDYPGDRRGFTLLTSSCRKMTIRIGDVFWVFDGNKCIAHVNVTNPALRLN
jgi:dCMP deaminase